MTNAGVTFTNAVIVLGARCLCRSLVVTSYEQTNGSRSRWGQSQTGFGVVNGSLFPGHLFRCQVSSSVNYSPFYTEQQQHVASAFACFFLDR